MPSGWLLAAIFAFLASIGYMVKGHVSPGKAFAYMLVAVSLFAIYKLGGLW